MEHTHTPPNMEHTHFNMKHKDIRSQSANKNENENGVTQDFLNQTKRTNKIKDYEIVKFKGKFEVRHIYGKNVYCKTFRTKIMANIHLFFKNLEC